MPESSATASSPVAAASARALISAFSSNVAPVSSTSGSRASTCHRVTEDLLDLGHLVGVARGQQHSGHAGDDGRGGGGSATAARCSSMISAMPFSARPSRLSSSARVNDA